MITKFYMFLFLLLSFQAFAQEKNLAISDFDETYRNEIKAENIALSERIKTYPQEIQDVNKQIGQSIRENNDKKALELALELNKNHPKNADIKNFIGKLRTKSLEYDEAIKFFDEAIQLEPKNKWFYVNKISVLAENRKLEEAMKETETLNSLFPKWSIGYNLKASLLYSLNQQSEALKAYETAIALEPKSAQILTNRGDLLVELSKESEAILDYKKALEIQPNYSRAQEGLKNVAKMKRK